MSVLDRDEKRLEAALKRLPKDKNALCDIYDLMGKAVYFTAYRILHNESDAEDALQNTMLALVETAGAYRGGGAASYILSVCRNQSLTIYGKRGNYSELDASAAVTEDGFAERITMLDALKLLSEHDRDIVICHALCGMKFKEIADEQGLSEQAAQKRYVRALQTLKKYYKER